MKKPSTMGATTAAPNWAASAVVADDRAELEAMTIHGNEKAPRKNANFVKSTTSKPTPETAQNANQAGHFSAIAGVEAQTAPIVSCPSIPSSSSSPSTQKTRPQLKGKAKVKAIIKKISKGKKISRPEKDLLLNQAVKAIGWARLDTTDTVKCYAQAMTNPVGITINVEDAVIAQALTKPDPVAWVRKAIIRRLEVIFGEDLKIVLVAEDNPGRPGHHYHGLLDMDLAQQPIVEDALRKAVGAWTGRAAKYQFDFDEQIDLGWCTYSIKQRGKIYAGHALTRAAKAHHQADVARRKARKEAKTTAEPVLAPFRLGQRQDLRGGPRGIAADSSTTAIPAPAAIRESGAEPVQKVTYTRNPDQQSRRSTTHQTQPEAVAVTQGSPSSALPGPGYPIALDSSKASSDSLMRPQTTHSNAEVAERELPGCAVGNPIPCAPAMYPDQPNPIAI